VNPLCVGAYDNRSTVHFYHETTSTAPVYSQQSTEVGTSHEQAPVKYCLDLRGTSFQLPPAMTMPSALTQPPSELATGGTHFSTSCTTASGCSVEQYGLLHQYSLPVTAATGDDLWQQLVPTSTYTCLQNTIATEAAAAAAFARSTDGGMTVQSEGPLLIAEEDDSSHSTLRTPELGSEVFLLKL